MGFAGSNSVEWDEPPVSIVVAQERYKKDVKPKATRTGWSVYGIVATVLFPVRVLIAAGGLAFSLPDRPLPFGLALIAVIKTPRLPFTRQNGSHWKPGGTRWTTASSELDALGIRERSPRLRRALGLARGKHRRAPSPGCGPLQRSAADCLAGAVPGTNGHLSVWTDATREAASPRFICSPSLRRLAGGARPALSPSKWTGWRLTAAGDHGPAGGSPARPSFAAVMAD